MYRLDVIHVPILIPALVFPFKSDDGHLDARVFHEFPQLSERSDDYYRNAMNVGQKEPRYVRICPCFRDEEDGNNCTLCNPAKAMFLAHGQCWQVSGFTDMASRFWADFAYRTRPITTWQSSGAEAKALQFRPRAESFLYSTGTDLGSLLQKISTVPQEIVDDVMVQLTGTAVGRILKTRQMVLQMLPRLALGTPTSFSSLQAKTVISPAVITSLCVTQRDILGQTYISGIGFNAPECPGLTVLSVDVNQKIKGLQCAISRFGLRAVRILYHGPPSPWLGEASDSWLGTVYGSNLRKLRVVSDVSKSG